MGGGGAVGGGEGEEVYLLLPISFVYFLVPIPETPGFPLSPLPFSHWFLLRCSQLMKARDNLTLSVQGDHDWFHHQQRQGNIDYPKFSAKDEQLNSVVEQDTNKLHMYIQA